MTFSKMKYVLLRTDQITWRHPNIYIHALYSKWDINENMVAPKARDNFDFGTLLSVNIPRNEMYVLSQ